MGTGAWRPAILLVEDDPGDALLVEEMVADSPTEMRFVWAHSLAQALEELRGWQPDCILLDLHLPDAQGLEALTRLQAGAKDVAVVVLTGLAEDGTGLEAVAAGAQDYLVKGRVDPELLSRAVRYAVQRKQAEVTTAALQAGQLRAQENARLERGLLPSPRLRDAAAFGVVARYRPGRAQALLGGDFYDLVQVPDGTVHAVIGDVSGHGPDEAALGVALRIAWRTLVIGGATGVEQMSLLEEVMTAERTGPEIFATLTSIELPPDGSVARIVRAGHPGLLVHRPGSVKWIDPPGGPALGMVPGLCNWPVSELPLTGSDALVVFTDGLFEGRTGPGSERMGESGLLKLAEDAADQPAEAFVDTLIARAAEAAADHGGLTDDIAVLHLHWRTTTGSST
ncbi:fused response regulator/phosphatase [Streptomyces sp. 549]|uniref:PP2C family protein-serine/threonine phosphatase n=1 Tax=Streptomyces sp. 549 TaxID=3049076 RepID=UPI0024C40FFA|nr:fused response regulator/phosphatase [Streptomyces sp. 549]MDK1475823.1 fused response regulator/phosphatase [Streptomyces sp. 549]